MPIPDSIRNAIADYLAGGVSPASPPATLYAAAFTAPPNSNGTGGTEVPSSNAYARVAITNNTTNFPSASGGSKSNGTDIIFPEATGSWGTITHIVFFDAPSGGNVKIWGTLTVSKAISATDQLVVRSGNLTLNVTSS
jgi:hypothetical protein